MPILYLNIEPDQMDLIKKCGTVAIEEELDDGSLDIQLDPQISSRDFIEILAGKPHVRCRVCGSTSFEYRGEKSGDCDELVYKCQECPSGYVNYIISTMNFVYYREDA